MSLLKSIFENMFPWLLAAISCSVSVYLYYRNIRYRKLCLTLKDIGSGRGKKSGKDPETSYAARREGLEALYTRIERYMENDKPYLEDDFSLEILARDVASNKSYVSKAVNRCYGNNFRRFVCTRRVEHAMGLIKENPRRKIQEIAAASGFSSSVSFTSAFKTELGMTPSEYQREIQSELI